jgi:hypothetical protein
LPLKNNEWNLCLMQNMSDDKARGSRADDANTASKIVHSAILNGLALPAGGIEASIDSAARWPG